MDVALISSMFEVLPRQGPGSDEATAFAGSFLPPDARRRKILDIGCGSGTQTLTLGKIFPEGQITALDLHQPFLDTLNLRAKKAGLDGRIVTHKGSMDDLPFEEGYFDIIWAEGSSFIIGIGNALRYWKKFLKPAGYLVFSDLVWFTGSPSEECRNFFQEISPEMPSEDAVEEMIRSEGYSLIGSFRLPEQTWWDQYYTPLTSRLGMLKKKYASIPDAQMVIQGLEQEREIYRKYSKEYGYRYFIMRSSGQAR